MVKHTQTIRRQIVGLALKGLEPLKILWMVKMLRMTQRMRLINLFFKYSFLILKEMASKRHRAVNLLQNYWIPSKAITNSPTVFTPVLFLSKTNF